MLDQGCQAHMAIARIVIDHCQISWMPCRAKPVDEGMDKLDGRTGATKPTNHDTGAVGYS